MAAVINFSPGSPALSNVAASSQPIFVDPLMLLSDENTLSLANEIADMPEDEPVLQGFLRKEGTSKDSWKRRWFVLWKDRLDYLKRQESEEAQGSIPIQEILGVIKDEEAYPQSHCFQLVTANRLYALQAPLEAAQKHWMTAIAAAVYHHHYHHRTPSAASPSSSSPDTRHPRPTMSQQHEAHDDADEEEAAVGRPNTADFLASASALFPSSASTGSGGSGSGTLSARQMAAALQSAAAAIVTHSAVLEATTSFPSTSSASAAAAAKEQIEQLRALGASVSLSTATNGGKKEEDSSKRGSVASVQQQNGADNAVDQGEEGEDGQNDDNDEPPSSTSLDMARAVSALEKLSVALAATRQAEASKSAKKKPQHRELGKSQQQDREESSKPGAPHSSHSAARRGSADSRSTAAKPSAVVKKGSAAASATDGPFEIDSFRAADAKKPVSVDVGSSGSGSGNSGGEGEVEGMESLLRHFAALRNNAASSSSSGTAAAAASSAVTNGGHSRPPVPVTAGARVNSHNGTGKSIALSATALAKVKDPEKAAAVAKAAAAALQNARKTKQQQQPPQQQTSAESAAAASAAAPVYRLSKLRQDYSRRWVNSLQLSAPSSGILGGTTATTSHGGGASSGTGGGASIELPLATGSKIAPFFRDGTLLCGLLETTLADTNVGDDARIEGMNPRPRARAACLHNLEKALQVIWKARVSRPTRIPTADELCDAREDKIQTLLPELMQGCGLKPFRSAWASFFSSAVLPSSSAPLAPASLPSQLQRVATALQWLAKITSRYGPVPSLVKNALRLLLSSSAVAASSHQFDLQSCPWTGLWKMLRDGVVMAQLAHYYGGDARNPTAHATSYHGIHSQQKHMPPSTAVNMAAVTLRPSTNSERVANWRAASPSLFALAGPHGGTSRLSLLTEDLVLAAGHGKTDAEDGIAEEDDDVALLHLLNLFSVLSPLPCGLPEVGLFQDPLAAQDELAAGLNSDGFAAGIALVPLFSLRICCGDDAIRDSAIPTVLLPDGTEAAKVVVGHSYAGNLDGWSLALPNGGRSEEEKTTKPEGAAPPSPPQAPAQAQVQVQAQMQSSGGGGDLHSSSPMKESPFVSPTAPPSPPSAASPPVPALRMMPSQALLGSSQFRTTSARTARSVESGGAGAHHTGRSTTTSGGVAFVDLDAGLVQRVLPFSSTSSVSAATLEDVAAVEAVEAAEAAEAAEQPVDLSVTAATAAFVAPVAPAAAPPAPPRAASPSQEAAAVVEEQRDTGAQQAAARHEDELLEMIAAERRRLLDISLARAAGGGAGAANRGKSAAVIKLAQQWADGKVRQWAQDLDIAADLVNKALSMPAAAPPAASSASAAEVPTAPPVPPAVAVAAAPPALSTSSPGKPEVRTEATLLPPAPVSSSSSSTSQKPSPSSAFKRMTAAPALPSPGSIPANSAPLLPFPLLNKVSPPRPPVPAPAAPPPATSAAPSAPEAAPETAIVTRAVLKCPANDGSGASALRPVVASLVASFPEGASAASWSLRWRTRDGSGPNGAVAFPHLAGVAVKQSGATTTGHHHHHHHHCESVVARLAIDKLHLSRASSGGLLVVELLPADDDSRDDFESFAASLLDVCKTTGLQATTTTATAATVPVPAPFPAPPRDFDARQSARNSPDKPAEESKPAASVVDPIAALPQMKRQQQLLPSSTPWPLPGTGAVLTQESGAPLQYPFASAPAPSLPASDPFAPFPASARPAVTAAAAADAFRVAPTAFAPTAPVASSVSASAAAAASMPGSTAVASGLHGLAARKQGTGLLASFLSARGAAK